MATTVYDLTDSRFDGMPLVPTSAEREEAEWRALENASVRMGEWLVPSPTNAARGHWSWSCGVPARGRKVHPRGYRPDLPTTGFTPAQLFTPTDNDRAAWAEHPAMLDLAPMPNTPVRGEHYAWESLGAFKARQQRHALATKRRAMLAESAHQYGLTLR